MKIATWNVNSIRARLPNVTEWLNESKADVILLQETKCLEEAFPYEAIDDLGYNYAVHGQKTFNGVAILSKYPIEDVKKGLPTFQSDPQARYIEAVVNNVRVASVYVPNGQSVGTEKYQYKMQFLNNLRDHLKDTILFEEAFVIGGDYNIAPEDIDIADPDKWRGKILCSDAEREAFFSLLYLGYQDAVRITDPDKMIQSWWDYRSRAWEGQQGLRIDHLLLSPKACDILQKTGVDAYVRGKDKASDHAPVWCELNSEI